MLYEWRSLMPQQRQDVAAQKDAYEATWMPTLRALRRMGALKARRVSPGRCSSAWRACNPCRTTDTRPPGDKHHAMDARA
jgi:hypothetical protein